MGRTKKNIEYKGYLGKPMEEDIYQKCLRRKDLTYRGYPRLTKRDQDRYMKSPLSINIKLLALKYFRINKKLIPFRKSLRWAKEHWDEYCYYASRHWYLHRSLTDDQLTREFSFRGFIPLEEFKKISRFNYIQSNIPIEGTIYVYPFPCGHTFKTLEKHEDVYKVLEEIGIQGYTKVDVRTS